MPTPAIITPDTMSKMLSLLDYCYKIGVAAVHGLQDEGLAREFLERTKEVGAYGILSENPIYTTWEEWYNRLEEKARRTAWSGAMTRFLSKAGRFGSNYLSVFYPVSFIFYRRGIADYLDAPNAVDFNIFSGKTRVKWTKSGIRKVSIKEYVNDIQLLTFDLSRRDQAAREEGQTEYMMKKVTLTPKQYESFRIAVGLANRKRFE